MNSRAMKIKSRETQRKTEFTISMDIARLFDPLYKIISQGF